MLAWLAADHRSPATGGEAVGGAKPVTTTGYYQVSPSREEKIALGAAEGIVAPGAWRPSMTEDLDPGDRRAFERDDRPAFAASPTPASRDDPADWPRHPDDPAGADGFRPLPLLHDSLVPSPREGEERGRSQLWIALALALLLGALLVAGLVVLGSSEREPPPPSGARP